MKGVHDSTRGAGAPAFRDADTLLRYHRRLPVPPDAAAGGPDRGRSPSFPAEYKTMSEDGFHVHGPHDHELEHAAAHGGGGMTGQLAVITAVLATIGAICSYMGGATQADAALAKNDAAIRKTEASDQWNFYQAKNARQAISEIALDLVPAERRDAYAKNIEKYRADKEPIKAKA